MAHDALTALRVDRRFEFNHLSEPLQHLALLAGFVLYVVYAFQVMPVLWDLS